MKQVSNRTPKVAVLGGGAAGFFAALSAAHHHPGANVVIFEQSNKLLSKVAISGGGRCNVTHACFSPSGLAQHYPRGSRALKKAFTLFQASDTVAWFAARGVELKTEADGRMFPITDTSQTIVDCLLDATRKAGISIRMQTPVRHLEPVEGGWLVVGERFDRVIAATGGSPKRTGLAWLEALGHEVMEPVPSLFTFNIPHRPLNDLMGLVAPQAIVRIQGMKRMQQGPVLITHWGLSGPAVLKLSAWEARELAERAYRFTVQVNWIGNVHESEVGADLDRCRAEHAKKQMVNACPFDLPRNLWGYLLDRIGLQRTGIWSELSKKGRNQLLNALLNDTYEVRGKTTFKEEFVTCGGVALSDVHFPSMESRRAPGLHFAGEILDIDGVTGGFNFQAAWTTGFLGGKFLSATP